ncbi:seven transmembrane domain protein [Heterostelium album PN500]|uniref:Seven transmembrane domain protein n=1 Tax=Heterostelium pallidum (strain ATCC 26659 / Pp 5 / PN500) TaxID=670386 RepID=D3BEM7_HETP5|nr:seven transmembrane domain protein [Heterostelium album PN500]EFA80358.1 seven transmembrane domain protein [Heterostelium album PN500]|eukprot:XP_020432478.1 seven transmembrane domain protein [Heterostelium album PN500]
MKFSNNSIVLVTLLVLSSLCLSNGFIHHLSVKEDARTLFLVETFGFGMGGVMNLNITNWKINNQPISDETKSSVGFYIQISETDASAFVDEATVASGNCQDMINKTFDYTIQYDSAKNPNITEFNFKIKPGFKEGYHNLYFLSCNRDTTVSFDLFLQEYNVDSNGQISYLSIGDTPLPTLYFVFAMAFFVILLLWLFVFLRGEGKRVNKIHYLCAAYLLVLAISLLFESIEKHYIKKTGSAHGWNIAYYIFACIQGSFFVILIALIGSGWAFIKPFLSDKDKTIFMVVIPLQILDNIALVMIDEEAPGSIGSLSWRHIFTVVDIICCIAIIVPIIWSIKHLKDASQVDDKAAQNMQKLKLFRHFYLMVISYLYFTRIFFALLRASLPFRYAWIGDFSLLLASLIFYCSTGYQFRPSLDNPYFNLPKDEDGIPLEVRDDEEDA